LEKRRYKAAIQNRKNGKAGEEESNDEEEKKEEEKADQNGRNGQVDEELIRD